VLSKSKKVVAVVMSAVMMLGFAGSAFASTSSVNVSTVAVSSEVTTAQRNGDVEAQGFKRWFAEKAVKGIADALRAGANNKWVKKAISEYFDADTAKVFKQNLDEIADFLDEAVRLSELSSSYIKDGIYSVVYKVTKNHGISQSISDGVTALIDIFL